LFFTSRRRHTRCLSDWSSDVCSSDLIDADAGLDPQADGEAAGRGDLGVEVLAGDQAAGLVDVERAGQEREGGGVGGVRDAEDVEIGRASCRERLYGRGEDGAGRITVQ